MPRGGGDGNPRIRTRPSDRTARTATTRSRSAASRATEVDAAEGEALRKTRLEGRVSRPASESANPLGEGRLRTPARAKGRAAVGSTCHARVPRASKGGVGSLGPPRRAMPARRIESDAEEELAASDRILGFMRGFSGSNHDRLVRVRRAGPAARLRHAGRKQSKTHRVEASPAGARPGGQWSCSPPARYLALCGRRSPNVARGDVRRTGRSNRGGRFLSTTECA